MFVSRDMDWTAPSRDAARHPPAAAPPFLCGFHRRIDQRIGQEQQLDTVWIAPGRNRVGAHFGSVFLHALHTAGVGDDRVGPAGSELLAPRRAASLADHWAPLRGAGAFSGPRHLK